MSPSERQDIAQAGPAADSGAQASLCAPGGRFSLWSWAAATAVSLACAAALAFPLPDTFRLVIALCVVLLWPGLAAIVLVLGSTRIAIVDLLALCLPASAGVLGVETLLAYAARPTISAMLFIHVCICAALSIAALLRIRRAPHRPGTEATGSDRTGALLDKAALALVIAFAIAFWPTAALVGPDLSEGIDAWFHLGYMAKMLYSSRIAPGCAFFQGATPDPRYPFAASHIAFGLLARFAGLPLLTVWAALSRFLPMLFLPALYFFTRQVFWHRPIALALVVLWMGAAFVCQPYSAPYFVHFWYRQADLPFFAAYPYPNLTAMHVLLPAVMALVASYLGRPSSLTLMLACLAAFGAAAWHIHALVWLPLFLSSLVCICLLARTAIGASLRVAAACAAPLLPIALLSLAAAARPSRMSGEWQGWQVVRFVAGDSFFIISPNLMFLGGVLGGLLVAAAVLLTRAEKPSPLAAAAGVVFVPLLNLNPVLASALAPWTTPWFLKRLYLLIPGAFYCMAPIVVVPVLVALAFELASGARRFRLRLLAFLFSAAVVIIAFPAWDVMERFMYLFSGQDSASAPIKGPLLLGAAVVLMLVGRGILHARLPRVSFLPRSPGANGLMIGLTALIGIVRALGLFGPVWVPAPAMPCRQKVNAAARWPLNAATGAPIFLEFIADHSIPFTTTVYSSDPFAAELTPAFAHQFTLYYDENANPHGNLPARRRASDSIADPGITLDETLRLLRRYNVGYIVTTTSTPLAHAKFQRHADIFPLLYRDQTAAVYRVPQ